MSPGRQAAHGQHLKRIRKKRKANLQSNMMVILGIRSGINHSCRWLWDLQSHALVSTKTANGFSDLGFVELAIRPSFQSFRQIRSSSIMIIATATISTPIISSFTTTTYTEIIVRGQKGCCPTVFSLSLAFA